MPDPKNPVPFGTTLGRPKGGHALWQYTGGTWVLKKDACEEGYEPGNPPREKGQYEGELRKTPGVPRGTHRRPGAE